MIFSFLEINIRGLSLKTKELVGLLNRQKIDVVILNELKITNHYSNESFQLPGWNIYSESHRCAVCVNNALNLKVEHVKLGLDHQAKLSAIPERQPSATAVRLTDLNRKRSILVVAAYLSPNLESKDILKVFEEVEKVKKIQEHVIITGDFNAHHMDFGSKDTHTKGRIIKQFLRTAPYRLLNNGKSTSTTKQAVLDLTFSSMSAYNNISGWRVLRPHNWQYISDHWPIRFDFQFPNKTKPEPVEQWNLKADGNAWAFFQEYTDSDVMFIPHLSAEENAINITKAIHKAALDSISKVTRTPKEYPWWNYKLEKLKKKKKRLQRQLTPS